MSEEQDWEDLGITEAEKEILKNALAKEAKSEELTIVEQVIITEFRNRLRAREHMRELQKGVKERNEDNGGPI